MKTIIFTMICLCCFCGCKDNKGIAVHTAGNASCDTVPSFPLPSIPAMLTSAESRAEYIAMHYWDNVDFADTTCLSHPDVMEQAWADYCDILGQVPPPTAREAMRGTIRRACAERKVLDYVTGLADKYLYNPNSPMRNEELYIPVLEAMLEAPVLDDTEKLRPKARLELARRNRVGSKAQDFSYTIASGAQGSLYRLEADYILLFFNNPGCEACAATIAELKQAPVINSMQAAGKLQVLSIYPDEELDEWRRHLKDFPREWTVGYDRGLFIQEQELYDLKAIPTLYLLDRGKKVLLKDVTARAAEEYLSRGR